MSLTLQTLKSELSARLSTTGGRLTSPHFSSLMHHAVASLSIHTALNLATRFLFKAFFAFPPPTPLVNNFQMFFRPHCSLKQSAWEVTVCWYQKAGPTDLSKSGSGFVSSSSPVRQVQQLRGEHCPRAPQPAHPQGNHHRRVVVLPAPMHLQNKESRKQNKGVGVGGWVGNKERIRLRGRIINIQPLQTTVKQLYQCLYA